MLNGKPDSNNEPMKTIYITSDLSKHKLFSYATDVLIITTLFVIIKLHITFTALFVYDLIVIKNQFVAPNENFYNSH